jgi:transcription elongation factor Elf1
LEFFEKDVIDRVEGAPQKVGGDFDCGYCNELKSLRGAPQKVGKDFYCNNCPELKSLRCAPKEVGKNFDCSDCGKLFDYDNVKKISKVKGTIYV